MTSTSNDVFDRSDDASRLFQSFVPHGDETFMVLKAHLVAERCLIEFVRSRAQSPSFLKDSIRDRNSPCRAGLGLILLAEGLSLRDEIPQSHAHIVWPALKILNGIRNQLAHELEPDDTKLKGKIQKFINAASPDIGSSERNLNQKFYAALQYVIALLAIDELPLRLDDAD